MCVSLAGFDFYLYMQVLTAQHHLWSLELGHGPGMGAMFMVPISPILVVPMATSRQAFLVAHMKKLTYVLMWSNNLTSKYSPLSSFTSVKTSTISRVLAPQNLRPRWWPVPGTRAGLPLSFPTVWQPLVLRFPFHLPPPILCTSLMPRTTWHLSQVKEEAPLWSKLLTSVWFVSLLFQPYKL